MIRRLLLPLAIGGAVGVPYLLGGVENLKGRVTSLWSGSESGHEKSPAAKIFDAVVSRSAGDLNPEQSEVSTYHPLQSSIQHMEEVFRFDVHPLWVISHWPHVTTHLADLDMQGMRVPLVTGTTDEDIAGSLTYYFDKSERVQRITFFGTAGDESKLVGVLSEKFGLQAQPILDRGLYLAKRYGKPKSALRVRHRSVLDASQRQTQLEIELELNRPGRRPRLSDRFTSLLDEDRNTGRW